MALGIVFADLRRHRPFELAQRAVDGLVCGPGCLRARVVRAMAVGQAGERVLECPYIRGLSGDL